MKHALWLFALASLAHANTPADYAYVFPLSTGDGTAFTVKLNSEVYRWSADPRLGDVEVFNASGHSVPMGFIATRAAVTTRELRAELPVFELPAAQGDKGQANLHLLITRDGNGRLRRLEADERPVGTAPSNEWLLDLSAFEHSAERLELRWSDATDNVVARLRVSTSDDLQSWRHVTTATVLLLNRDGIKVDRRFIPVTLAGAKYVKLTLETPGVTLTGLTAAATATERSVDTERDWLEAAGTVAAKEPNAPATRIDYRLESAITADRARVELRNDNALASYTLYGRTAPDTPWLPLGGDVAYRLRIDDEVLHNGELVIGLSGFRMKEFRFESSVPLAEPPLITLGYRPQRLVFLTEGEGPFVLAAGSRTARHGTYEIETALMPLRAKLGADWQPPLASPGAGVPSAGEAAFAPPPKVTPWTQYVLWGVLVLGALVVTGFSLSLLRGNNAGGKTE